MIMRYESSPGVYRAFCGTCGSRLPMSGAEIVPVPAGLLNTDLGMTPEVNMHLASKSEWAIVDDSIHCLQDQGSEEFWASFMEAKSGT